MITATQKLTVPPRTPVRGLPLLATFEQDDAVNRALGGVLRYRRTYFSDLGNYPAEVDRVLITSSERMLEEHGRNLHAPNIRILGLSETRFKDYRLDGLVYAYLIPGTPISLIERMIDNALDHIHLVASRQEVNARLAFATREINELNEIGAALSAEHDTGKLLEMILTKCREITSSDAGSLYVVEETGLPVNIEDAYHLPSGVPYTINRKFDEDSGYRTKSILAVPMKNQKGEVVGVVQLINSKRDFATKLVSVATVTDQVVPFTMRQQEIVASLASQAAVAYENSQLYEAIQRLFEGFVRASVVAIESRDPTTSGHSFRVANLTVALAEAVDRVDSGPYKDIRFSRSEMKEIRYASLLHDFGKVGVREEVLVKAKKLYPAQLDVIRQRFQFVKRSMETETLRARLDYVLEKGREEYLAKLPAFDQELSSQLVEVDRWFQIILSANEPTILADGSFEVLNEIAARHYKDYENAESPLLDPQEIKLLSIRKGSLDDAERLQIESHVIHTFNFLQQIPWTKEIRSIPEIARAHHEKLNGKGYPYRLSAPEIPVQTRIMTISDIFDALSAVDRPYKKAVGLDRALEILGFAVKDGEIDAGLFQLFRDAKVFERWKIEPFPY